MDKRLNGNYILFLLIDAEDLEKASQRFLINKNDKKILEDYLNIKGILKNQRDKYMHFSPSSWTEFIENRNLNDETVKLLICDGVPYWRNLFKWLFIYKSIKSKKNGETLKKRRMEGRKGNWKGNQKIKVFGN